MKEYKVVIYQESLLGSLMQKTRSFSFLAALLLSAPALAYSPAPSANVSSQEYGSVSITNPMLSPVPARSRAHFTPQHSTEAKATLAKAAPAQALKHAGQCKAKPFDPNASTAPAPQATILPPRRHLVR